MSASNQGGPRSDDEAAAFTLLICGAWVAVQTHKFTDLLLHKQVHPCALMLADVCHCLRHDNPPLTVTMCKKKTYWRTFPSHSRGDRCAHMTVIVSIAVWFIVKCSNLPFFISKTLQDLVMFFIPFLVNSSSSKLKYLRSSVFFFFILKFWYIAVKYHFPCVNFSVYLIPGVNFTYLHKICIIFQGTRSVINCLSSVQRFLCSNVISPV